MSVGEAKNRLKHRRHKFDHWSEDPLEEEMATYSSIFTEKSLWTAEPGRLRSQGVEKSCMTEPTKHHHPPES